MLKLIEAGRGFPHPLREGLAGYWQMEESAWTGAADEVKDSSGSGNHGVAAGGATTTSSGILGRGGLFVAASGQYIDCGGASALNVGTGDFTIAAWINTTQGTNARIVSKRGFDGVYWLIQTSSGKARIVLRDGVYTAGVTSDADINDGLDHIIVGVRDNGLLWIYVDGVGKSVVDTTAGNTLDNAVAVTISEGPGLGPFEGVIDEVTFWMRALAAQEINYISNLTEPLPDSITLPLEAVNISPELEVIAA